LLSIQTSLSNKTIRRGDQFGIYLTVKNGFNYDIWLEKIELTAPMGFNSVKQKGESKKRGLLKNLADSLQPLRRWLHLTSPESTNSGTSDSSESSQERLRKKLLQRFPDEVNVTIPRDGYYRYEYLFQAGRSIGSSPKPDTHTISIKLCYSRINSQKREPSVPLHQEPMNIEVSIFPAFTSMLLGTLTGGFLGTMAVHYNQCISKCLPTWDLLSKLVFSLIFSFIAGVVLMRRKDVQSFITIEDFWGGILIGFVIGYGGIQGLQNFLHLPFTNQTSMANATLAHA